MSLFKSVILLDVMQIVSPYHDCPLHLHALHDPRQNATTNADISCEGTLFVDVCSLNGLKYGRSGGGKVCLCVCVCVNGERVRREKWKGGKCTRVVV